jgi:GTP pyrophosphokinase
VDDNILFFRSDGNLCLVPAGATVLDGAFRIHSRRALKCIAAFCNDRPANFTDTLHFGDVLSIEYGRDYPTDASRLDNWKSLVTTKLALKAIEKARRGLLRDSYIDSGKKIIADLVGNVGMSIDELLDLLDDGDRRGLTASTKLSSLDEMLFLAGVGEKSAKPGRIANRVRERLGLGPVPKIKLESVTVTLSEKQLHDLIVIPSVGGQIDHRFARCCGANLVYGASILARASSDGYMSVHLDDCVNVQGSAGLIKCDWELPDTLKS